MCTRGKWRKTHDLRPERVKEVYRTRARWPRPLRCDLFVPIDFFHALRSEVDVGCVSFSPLSARAHQRSFRCYKSIARELQPRFCPGFSGFLPKVS
ncbi:hypothetical protein HF521_016939 [Silurus meridionalis]|uniref:Uncharacterized protein n=1 Tax=Silurus meridionalis TaxID=175797 RepID=A0A8T0BKU0_SILME|nr:hypothetical protein HF521_016939 [Silurus meridionalis]